MSESALHKDGELEDKYLRILEAAFMKTLSLFFPRIKPGTTMAEFFATYLKEADDFDRDFTKKHDEDLNTTLIFAGLFSAVTSAFILDVQANLQPDYAQETAALLRILIQNGSNSTSQPLPEEWSADSGVVTAQAILYASLAASLLAAFLAVLGKQWLNRYMHKEGGSAVERLRDRQVKADGMEMWKFSMVMEVLPLMLQIALLLFGCALSRYLWTVNTVVAAVNIFFTAVGMIIYTAVLFFATLSYACPYQTPLSFAFRYALQYDKKHTHYVASISSLLRSIRPGIDTLGKEILGFSSSFCALVIKWAGTVLTFSRPSGDVESGNSSSAELHPASNNPHTSELDANVVPQSISLVDTIMDREHVFSLQGREEEFREHALNASCVLWILDTSTDPEVVLSAVRAILEINWTHSTRLPELGPLVELLDSCHDPASRYDFETRSGMEQTALIACKALFHVYLHRSLQGHVGTPSGIVFREDLSLSSAADDEFKTTIDILRYCSGVEELAMWWKTNLKRASISEPHISWLCQMILYHMWLCQRDDRQFPLDLFEFLKYSCAKDPMPSTSVINDCIVIAGLAFGLPFNLQDLSAADKSPGVPHIVVSICDRIRQALQDPDSELAPYCISALELITAVTTKGPSRVARMLGPRMLRSLLHVIINSSVDPYERWRAAQLVLKIEVATSRWGPAYDFPVAEHCVEDLVQVLDRTHTDQQSSGELLALVVMHKSAKGSVSVWKENIISVFCKLLKPGGCSESSQKLILQIVADSQAPESLDGTADLGRQLSSSIRDLWDSLPQKSYPDYVGDLANLLLKLQSNSSWHHFLISDFSQPFDYLSKQIYPGDRVVTLFWNLDHIFFKSLEEAHHPVGSKAFLKLAWKLYYCISPGVIPSVISATTELLRHGDRSIIDEFEPLVTIWVQCQDELLEGIEEEGPREALAGLVRTYLTSAWKASPDLNSNRLLRLLHTTAEVYAVRGHDYVDETVIHLWMTAAWAHATSPLQEVVKEVTLKTLIRGGETVMNEYRSVLPPSETLRELEQNLAYMKVAEGRAGFDEEDYRKLQDRVETMRERARSLEEIWENACREDLSLETGGNI